MAKYVCYPVEEPKFDARMRSSVMLANLTEAEMSANFPDHYPNDRVTALEERVDDIEESNIEDIAEPSETIDDDDNIYFFNTSFFSITWAYIKTHILAYLQDTLDGKKPMHGFEDLDDSSVNVVYDARPGQNKWRFYLAVVSVSYDVRVNGTQYTVLYSVMPRYYIEISQLDDGLHYIYFVVVDGALSLVSSTDEWDLSDLTIVPVATVLKEDATTYTLVDKRYNYLADPKASHFLANAEEYDLNDVMIPALDSYNEDLGEIDDAKFTWLGATAKSTKSWFSSILDKIYAHITATAGAHPASAVALSESFTANNAAILANDTIQAVAEKTQGQINYFNSNLINYTVAGSAAAQIDLNITIAEDTPFIIWFDTPAGWYTGAVTGVIRINDISGAGTYANGSSAPNTYFMIYGGNVFSKISVKACLINGDVQFNAFYERCYGTSTYAGSTNTGCTIGQAITSITKISIAAGTGVFPVGSKVILKLL
jgi:hypothetical protein